MIHSDWFWIYGFVWLVNIKCIFFIWIECHSMFFIMSLKKYTLVIYSLSYHTSPYCGTPVFWLLTFTPALVDRYILSSTSLMLSTRLELENKFTLDLLYNIIQFFIGSCYSIFVWGNQLLSYILFLFMMLEHFICIAFHSEIPVLVLALLLLSFYF